MAKGFSLKRLWFSVIVAAIASCELSANVVAAGDSRQFLLGADISALGQAEDRGVVFRDGGKPVDAIKLFHNRGWNCFRLRLFVNPNGRGGTINTLAYTEKLARRIRASGATLILDLHYSDTWADPQHQVKPAAWKDLPFDELEKTVEQYTAGVIAEMKAAGCEPDIVQIGNEITGGTLWPDAQLAVPLSTVKVYDATVKPIKPPEPYDDAAQWSRLLRILAAGARGVREADGRDGRVRIMIHIDCGGDWPITKWYLDHLTAGKIDFDIVGQSYYPYWHGTLANVRENLRQTAERYHKDIVIVETAYPYKNPARWAQRKNMDWPISAAGQASFLTELVRTVRATPDGRGLGVVYWYPESVPPPNRRPQWNGGDTALFDADGNALPAISAAGQAAQSSEAPGVPGDPATAGK
jgi:arabinogalactan endo-1,4-beta-galactosidase